MEKWSEWAKEHTGYEESLGKAQPLDDIKVLDLSYGSFAGLFASSLLAEMGAEVVRVEPPGGDIARQMSPEGIKINGTGLAYIVEGRNKYSITLDITKSKGLAILKELLPKFDVLIETFPSGFLESLGLGGKEIEKINPNMIYCPINGSVHSENCSDNPAERLDYDITAQALSGFVWMNGLPEDYTEFPENARVPTRMGNWMGWYAGGMMAAFSIMSALIYRDSEQEGQAMDISPAESLMALNNYAIHYYYLTGNVINRVGNFEPAAYAYNYFQAKDGMVFIAGYVDQNWKALCSIIGRDDLVKKYPTTKERTDPKNFIPMTKEIEKFTKRKTRNEIAKLWLNYKGAGVTVAGEILEPDEAMKIDHWYERRALICLSDKDFGKFTMQGIPAKMSGSSLSIKWICRDPGEDNEFIYSKFLGYDRDILEELSKEGVIV